MDFYEACDGLAANIGKIEYGVGGFITKHGAVLPSDVVEQLQVVEGIAAEYCFDIHRDGGISKATNSAAADVYEKLKSIENKLIFQVRTQSST